MRAVLMLSAVMIAALGGCTWVRMAPGGAEVRVARASDNLSGCQRRGQIAVSVKDRLGPIERNGLKVRDELEVLARNEAPGLGADTVQQLGEPVDGEQRFGAFQCGGNVVGRDQPGAIGDSAGAGDGAAEVIPLED